MSYELIGGINNLNFAGKAVRGLQLEEADTVAGLVSTLSIPRSAEAGASTLVKWTGAAAQVTDTEYPAQSSAQDLVPGENLQNRSCR